MDNIEFQRKSIETAFEAPSKIDFVVLPWYKSKSNKSNLCLTSFSQGKFVIVEDEVTINQKFNDLKIGDLITAVLEGENIKFIKKTSLLPVSKTRLGYKYNPGRGLTKLTAKRTKLFQGQVIVIEGSAGEGKTTRATKIADGFDKNGFELFKVLFGQRRTDRLGSNSINIDSSATIKYQLNEFYFILDKIVRAAHEGKDCCLVIDSIDKFITMQHEQIPKDLSQVISLVKNLFYLSGNFSTGSITIICTRTYYDNSISKKIRTQIESLINARIWASKRITNGKYDYSKIK